MHKQGTDMERSHEVKTRSSDVGRDQFRFAATRPSLRRGVRARCQLYPSRSWSHLRTRHRRQHCAYPQFLSGRSRACLPGPRRYCNPITAPCQRLALLVVQDRSRATDLVGGRVIKSVLVEMLVARHSTVSFGRCTSERNAIL